MDLADPRSHSHEHRRTQFGWAGGVPCIGGVGWEKLPERKEQRLT